MAITVAQIANRQGLGAPRYAPPPRSAPCEGSCRFKRQISSIRYENREIGGLHHQEFVAVRSWRATQCRRPINACSRGGAFFESSATQSAKVNNRATMPGQSRKSSESPFFVREQDNRREIGISRATSLRQTRKFHSKSLSPALGFHLHGADLCLQAAMRGLAVVAIEAPCEHNIRYNSEQLDHFKGSEREQLLRG
jgi:hypothetical protein